MSILPEHHATDPVSVIDFAELALRTFGADLSRDRAALLLCFWRYHDSLSPRERTAVLARFGSGGGS